MELKTVWGAPSANRHLLYSLWLMDPFEAIVAVPLVARVYFLGDAKCTHPGRFKATSDFALVPALSSDTDTALGWLAWFVRYRV